MPNTDQTPSTKVRFQFKYGNYVEIMPFADEKVRLTTGGERPRATVKARNFRVELDLSDPIQKLKHDALMASPQLNVSFWLVDGKPGQQLGDKAETLERALKMTKEQLIDILGEEGQRKAGIVRGKATHMQLVLAVVESKNIGAKKSTGA